MTRDAISPSQNANARREMNARCKRGINALRLLLGVFTLALCLSPARTSLRAQQQPAAQTQTEHTPVSASLSPASWPLVKLNLIVTDESDQSIADVPREDVSILEDGVPQVITYFATVELPVSYTLVFDNSGSMRRVMDVLVKTGGSFFVANKAGDETALMRFVDSDNIRMLADFTESRAVIGEGLEQLYIEGGQTAILDAVYLAVDRTAQRRADEGARRRAIVLITDGDERASYYKLSRVQELLRKNRVQVFVLGLMNSHSYEGSRLPPRGRVKLLDALAQESGGHAFYPNNVSELAADVSEISRELRTQYVVGYTSTNATANGKFRKVEVKVADVAGRPKRMTFTRTGYYAPGDESKEKDKKR